MQNEQCGFCWDLKFDNRGKETHDQKYPHDFIPIDYCEKCREPKYDSYRIQTHPENIRDFLKTSNMRINHEFNSGINAKSQEKKKRQKNILVYFVIVSSGVTAILNISNMFF